MQLALNVVVFIAGILIAGVVSQKPNKSRASLDQFLSNLRYILDAFSSNPGNAQAASKADPGDVGAPGASEAKLLSK
jgi:hypothetical protein